VTAAAERFLHAIGQAVSSYTLYGEGHQAREEAITKTFAALQAILRGEPFASFSFLDDAVVYNSVALHTLRDWTWTARLASAGVRRLELSREATRASLDAFLTELYRRLNGDARQEPMPMWVGIAAGDVVVLDEQALPATSAPAGPAGPYSLTEEVGAVHEAFLSVARGGRLPLQDMEAVVHALSLALHSEGELLIPLLSLRSLDDHTALHAVNTAILAMTFSEWLGLAGGDIRAVGKAALLHDVGMARVSADVFQRPELSTGGRGEVSRHPEEGARLLLSGSSKLDLAATAAYEHHLRIDGTGYPARRFHRELHYISRIVAVCGAYDALRSERSYRPAREPAHALAEIEAGAGAIYDPGVAHAFVQMMRRWEHRLVSAGLGPPVP
jgi:HD-GYP domain-containing protein (c-di-GMP phosphodiesterase class II)